MRLIEDDASNLGQYADRAKALNIALDYVRQCYIGHLDSGWKQAEAEEESVRYLKESVKHLKEKGVDLEETHVFNEFLYRLFAKAAIRGMHVSYLEAYDNDTCNDALDLKKYRDKVIAEATALMNQAAPPLISAFFDKEWEYQTRAFNRLSARDTEIPMGLEQRFKDTEALFHLRPNNPATEPLRALGYMGTAHNRICYNFNYDDRSMELNSFIYSDGTLEGLVMNSVGTRRPLNRRECDLLGIAHSFLDRSLDTGRQSAPKLVRQGVNHAFRLSEGELQRISRDSEKINDKNKRIAFVLNEVVGAKLFSQNRVTETK